MLEKIGEALWKMLTTPFVLIFEGFTSVSINSILFGLLLLACLASAGFCLYLICLAILDSFRRNFGIGEKRKTSKTANKVKITEADIGSFSLGSNKRDRQKYEHRLDKMLEDVQSLLQPLEDLLADRSDYLMKADWDKQLSLSSDMYREISGIPSSFWKKVDKYKQLARLVEIHSDKSALQKRNECYKQIELRECSGLLDDVNGNKLDDQQRNAVVTDEYNNLVIAGAGSGKSLTIVGKVKYLVQRKGVKPEDILVTSFTRASVFDLEAKIESAGISGVAAKTFHKIGLELLGKVDPAKENTLSNCVKKYLSSTLVANSTEAAAFIEFYGMRNIANASREANASANARMASLKSADLRTLKGLVSGPGEGLDTWQGERVKSNEELLIANFLFLNGVEYEYEKGYTGDIPKDLLEENRRWYRPDFYLPEYDIWFEHFGINKTGRPEWILDAVEQQRYVDGMAWKREVHQRCGTRLIESYSYWNDDQDFLNQVSNLLTSNGVILKPDTERNAENCRKLLRNKSFYSSIGNLIETFISLAKSNNESLVEIEDRARELYRGNGTMWHRFQLFMTFTRPVMALYANTLKNASQVDFDDMINLATQKARSSGIDAHYRYIIIDEYQDISRSRLELILAIRAATGAKLMCVGDDWQAIYRFAGSDVTLFTNFEKLVGYHETMRIEHTYRNSQQLVDVASSFILKNHYQLPKKMQALPQKSIESPIAIIALNDMQDAFVFALNKLLALPNRGGHICILGRNRRDLTNLFPQGETPSNIRIVSNAKKRRSAGSADAMLYYKPDNQDEQVEMEYRTVHKSKGLEADNVIVLNLVNDLLGFPNMIEDDPILELLLADSDAYPMSEERRLFYVALTRTKNYVWLICPGRIGRKGQSQFIAELNPLTDTRLTYFAANSEMDGPLCPVCGGTLLTDTNKKTGQKFVRCSNWPYCDKSYRDIRIVEDKKMCPECGGYMIRRTNGRTGEEFFGCTNWPDYCNYTCSIDAS